MLTGILNWLQNGLLDFTWWQLIIYGLVVTHITIAAVTIFLHRSQAHRALDLHAIPSHFFRFWLWLTTGMVTKEWVSIHRKHHAKCETEEDPHSPQIKGIKEVLFRGAELYRLEGKNQETMQRYGHGTPDDWIERNIYSKYSAKGVVLMLIINIALFGFAGLSLWALQMAWIPITAAGIINGAGHYWGYRNFECKDASTNLLPWGILIGGEELHNNHHTYATSARLSNKWYEFDIGWLYIRILEICGLAKVKKIAPVAKLQSKQTNLVCNQNTLDALIHHRYDAMARYKKMLEQLYQHEVTHLKQHAHDLHDKALAVRNTLYKKVNDLTEHEKQTLKNFLDNNQTMQKAMHMRDELTSLWEKSALTKEELVVRLQQWCAKAEQSGIETLKEFSQIIQRYELKQEQAF